MRTLPSSSLTDPDVQVSRVRFFIEEFCSHRCSDGRSGLPAEGDAVGGQRTGSWGTVLYDPVAPATSARSSRPDGRTSLGVDSCLLCHSRRNGPASSRSNVRAGRGWFGAGSSDTKPCARAYRFFAVTCRTTFLPARDLPHTWVKPRKVNEVPSVSGWLVAFGLLLRKSTKRVLSGWSVSPYRASRLPSTPRTRLASRKSSNAITASSAKRTRVHLPLRRGRTSPSNHEPPPN